MEPTNVPSRPRERRRRPDRPSRGSRVPLLPQLLAVAVEANPTGVAVVAGDRSLSYAELDALSSRLARVLIGRGVGPESAVAIGIRRSLESVVAVWAVAKAGAAYVPVDPNYPQGRIEYMLADSNAGIGITTMEFAPVLGGRTEWIVIDDPAVEARVAAESSDPVSYADRVAVLRAEHPAYVIYTSGSTGQPKGVLVTHGGLASLCASQGEYYQATARSRVLHFASPSFDVAVGEMLLAVGAAATLVVAPTDLIGGAELASFLREQSVTHLIMTPTVLATVDPAGLDMVETVVVGGEACPPELVELWAPGRRFVNGYGPTETTVVTNISAPLVAGGRVNIGKPIRNTASWVLDGRLHRVQGSAVGELYLSGPMLARGYHARRGLTAERFVANPFVAGERMYRTGDLVRWRRDGELEFVGRSDFQVKVRGFRIELGEIDAVLALHESVRFAVTVGRQLDSGATALVSYVQPAPGTAIDTGALAGFVGDRLPGHMVPAAFVVIEQVPLTPVGKLDRNALPAPVFEVAEFRAPTTAVEQVVAGVFAEVLGIERVGLDDDFFALGGNSLVATQVVSRVGAALDITVPVRLVFEASTVARLAVAVESHTGTGRVALVAGPRPERIPLSFAQSRMWFLNRLDPESATYNVPLAIRLTGDLDVVALQAAVADVVGRHESLRTIYPEVDGVGFQHVLPAGEAILDLVPVPVGHAEVSAEVAAFVGRGFDVTEQVPVRARLFRVTNVADVTDVTAVASEFVLVVVVHHIAGDGSSVAPLARDVMLAYESRSRGEVPGWLPLPVQYVDYALWQREVLGSEDDPGSLIARQLGYWRERLAGLPDVLELPSDRARPAVQSFAGATVAFTVSAEVHAGLVALARDRNATLFMVVHAAVAVLLARLSGTGDIAVGSPIAGRGERELDDLIGMFVNTLVLRTDIDGGESFTDLLARVRESDVAAFGHADVPFERLVEELNPSRSTAYSPLFQVLLVFQNFAQTRFELPGLRVEGVEAAADSAKFDLQVSFSEGFDEAGTPSGFFGGLSYATDLFDEATVRSFADRLLSVFAAVVADPDRVVGDVDLLDADEQALVVREWNDTAAALDSSVRLPDLFDRAVAASPDAVAVVFEGESLTYAEFAGRVNRLARYLMSIGVGPETVVAVAMRRSIEMVTAVHAVIAAGGAYVPIDPDQPVQRVAYVLDSAAPVAVLTTTNDRFDTSVHVPVLAVDALDVSGLPGGAVTDAERVTPLRADNTAYVIYTSGSTGRPKGVALTHAATVNQLLWAQHRYRLEDTDAVLFKTPFTFDVSVWELFWTLQTGARLVIAVPDGHRDPAYLAQIIAAESITTIHFVPSMLAAFMPALPGLTSLRRVFVAGEALPLDSVTRFAELSDAQLHNWYGPAEAEVVTAWAATTEATRVPIGSPVWNTQVYVLDARLHPVPVGVAGELYLAGTQLARGYHRRAELTADRFVANPFEPGQRLYRTGDLVRWTVPAGELEYLGRTDFQVKLRGQRIELGEIEAALLDADGAEQAVVLMYTDATAGDRLVAYLTPGTVDPAAALHAVRAKLPTYMVPTQAVVLEAFPLNASGKLDRKALPTPVFTAAVFRAPTTPVEQVVAGVFAEVLGIGASEATGDGSRRVGLDDDFFALGGNSLVAMQVTSRLGAALDTTVPVRLLFEAPTVERLAVAVESHTGTVRVALVARERPERIPLSLAQTRMWFLNRLDPESATYNIPMAIRLSGELDTAALQLAVTDVLDRHESLRTVYPEVDGLGYQLVLSPEQVGLDLAPVPVGEDDLLQSVSEFVSRPFDVTVQAVVRAKLFAVAGDEHVLAVVAHHIAADGVSMGPLARDVMVAYESRTRGEVPGWTPLPVQYADYTLWQRQVLGSEDDPGSLITRQLDYWTTQLAGVPEELGLPTDRPRPAVASSHGATVGFEVPVELHAGLLELARAHEATLFMVVHTAVAVLLARLSGTNDIAVGTPIAGRGERELDDLIGMFVNTLVLRTRVEGGASVAEVLAQARATDVGAFGHADVPFERLVEVLDPARSQARHPLFQVALSFQNHVESRFELPGLTVSGIDAGIDAAKFDLHVTVSELGAGGLAGALTYATDLFDEQTMVDFGTRLVRVLEAMVADPTVVVGDIGILAAGEARHPLTEGRERSGTALLADVIGSRGGWNPDAVAVRFEGRSYSYRELEEQSNRLARWLISRRVGPETRVALALPRSYAMVLAEVAVAKSGAAFVPVDPSYPLERVEYMLADSAAVLGVTGSEFVGDLPADGFEWLVLDAPGTDAVLAELSAGAVTDADRVAPVRVSNTAYTIYTSGSTGRPKGVAVTHSGIGGLLDSALDRYGLTADSRFMSICSPSFDPSVLDWVAALSVSATLVVVPSRILGGEELAVFMAEERVTHTIITPAVLASMGVPPELPDLEVVSVGGDVSTPELVARWAPGRRYFNGYGPTETTIITTYAELRVGTPITIGNPVAGAGALVLDARLHPVPDGVAGELYLVGAALARGYHERAGLTAERFVADPHGAPGDRMYRTGDVVRWNRSGELEFVGRSDFQVKIRGFRVELGEIDAALEADVSVFEAVTVGHRDAARGVSLVSYVVAAPGAQVDVTALTAAVADVLPSYMVPAQIMVLDAFPLTPIGKLDRNALPAPVFETAVFRAPTTVVEQVVAGVFAEVLGIERVGLDDDFFALGGNSLVATQVVSRVGAALDITVPVRLVFEASTVARLAVAVESHTGTGRVALVAGPRPERIPLSFAQSRMWFLNRLDPESATYNVPLAIRLTGDLDVVALQAAVADVVGRHESLRTIYPEVDGVGFQHVLPAGEAILDLVPVPVGHAEVSAEVAAFVGRGFDVTEQVPVRARLFRVTNVADVTDVTAVASEFVLVVVVHHIAGDGSSVAPLARDVMLAYESRSRGEVPGWLPLPVQYVDYALWQREVLGSEDDPGSLIARQLGYWRERLAGLPDVLELPSDRARPAVQSFAGATVAFTVSAEVHAGLVALARDRNATLFMVVHAAVAVLLARLSGTGDIAVGSPIAGRGERELDDLIGMFVNTLVLRTDIDGGESFTDLLARVRESDVAAFGHADVPFERLVEELNPSRSTAYSPLFQVLLVFQNFAQTRFELPGLRVEGVEAAADSAKFDLQVSFSEGFDEAGTPSGFFGGLSYATDLFDEATVRSFADRLLSVFAAVVADPDRVVGDVDLLDADEQALVVREWNDTAAALDSSVRLPDLFDRAVAASPDAVAVVFEGESLTYAEFAGRVNRLARYLMSIGVGPETVVAVAMRRSIEMVTAVHAVIAAGGAYVPIDPDQPVQRVAYVLDSAAPVAVLTTTNDRFDTSVHVPVLAVDALDVSGLPGGAVTDAERVTPLRADNTAYVIYTSGSTGRPKGVALTHAATVNQLLWAQHRYRLEDTDAVLFKTPFTFDVSVWELFWTLQTGARLVIAVPDGHRDPAYLAQIIAAESITTMHFVPSMLAAFMPALPGLTSLRRVFVAGEALPLDSVTRFAELSDAQLHNWYGPAEAEVVTAWAATTEATRVPIGSPVWNTQVYVLDARLHPVPVGVAGELYLAGTQLARGYHRRAELTADRFVANPFEPGQRLYRTGDLVRWTVPAGELEYLGRTDFQVKLRGQRIELGEIEAALLDADGAEQAVVLMYTDATAGDRLVAYLTPGTVDPAAALHAVRAKLPTYMVPTQAVVLEAFPLNASGKLDRKALPTPVFTAAVFRAPTTPVEQVVAGVFAEVLGIGASEATGDGSRRVGLDDDFFALGGNSLVAMQVTSRLGAALDTTVPVRLLFEAPTVERLAVAVESHTGTVRVALVARERPERIPLSLAQTRMWFLNRLDPESATYNIPMAIRLSGELDTAALQLAVTDVLDRHESLRTVYPEVDGLGYQLVLSPEQVGLDLAPVPVGEDDLLQSVSEFVSRPFDVTVQAVVRAKLFAVAGDEHVLAVVAHHIAADGVSMGPLARDVMVAYESRTRGEVPGWTPLPVQYADYTLWQRQVLGSEDDPGSLITRQLDYWTTQLAGVPEELGLPTDRPRPAVASSHGATVGFEVPVELHAGLLELARAHEATLFMVVHTAVAVLLARLSGTNDIAVGTPIAGRGERELDDLIGMFVNTLVLRTRVEGGASVAEVLAQARATDVGAFGHADVPFERLVEVLDPARSQARHPLFQVALSFQNHVESRFELPGLTVSGLDAGIDAAKFDLHVTVSELGAGGLAGALTYATDLFDEVSMVDFGRRLVRVFEAMVADPAVPVGDIEIHDPAERATLVHRWSGAGVSSGADVSATLVGRFGVQVARDPGAVAVVFEGESLTYGELAVRARRLARYLIGRGVGPDSLVGVALPRSLDVVVAMLAVVEAGAGYVPLDPTYPAERIEYVVADSAPVCVISWSGREHEFTGTTVIDIDALDLSAVSGEPIADAERTVALRPEHVAYVIYTSGSTGRPKGVAVAHRNVVELLAGTEELYGFGAEDVWTMFHSVAFDFSVWELWGPLLTGGRLVVVDYLTSRSPAQFLELVAAQGVTVLNQTPSAFYQFVEADRARSGVDVLALRYVIFGGEALEPRRLGGWFDRRSDLDCTLVNMYGITETTVHVTHRRIDASDTAAASVVGGPIAGLRVYVLDSRLRPVPMGVAGEVYVAGGQLARGYLGRRELNATRFVADPFGSGGRLYRSGDVARWTHSGELEFVGRADDQVKVRGFRIELGEIEAVVAGLPGVGECAVVVREDIPGDARLVAYAVPAADSVLDGAVVRTLASESLPAYMVPSAFVVLDAIPLTVNGKLDRKALPAPQFEAAVFRAPTTPIEQAVADVFAEVLGDGSRRVGLDDDFFAMGGNSLLATQVVSRLGAVLDATVPVRVLFEASTVERLAVAVESHTGTGRVALVPQARPERVPLSLAQSRMWFLNRLDPDSAVYNIPMAIRLAGELNVDALQAAVGDVLARHESLRTIYPEVDGLGYQLVLPPEQVGLDLAPGPVGEAELFGAVSGVVGRGFDVTEQLPVRARLFRITDVADVTDMASEFVLVVVVHHITGDGVSMGPLARDVMVAYESRTRGESPGWTPLPVQYADYALWQRQVLGSEDDPGSLITRQLDYWTTQLAGVPDELGLPTDRPRPAVASNRGATVGFEVPAELHAGLVELARAHEATLFMVVHAGLAVLLARLSGGDDVAIGTPIAGRGERELDDLIGMFVNTLVLRTRVEGGASVTEVLTQARVTDVGAFGHADVPFERLVEVLDPARSRARHPLFQVALSFQNLGTARFELPGLTVSGLAAGIDAAKFDLEVTVSDLGAGGLAGALTYATDLFDEVSMVDFGRRLVRVFEAMVADPGVPVGDIEILDADERSALLAGSVGTGHEVAEVLLRDGFERAVAGSPDAVAVVFEGESLTYDEFATRVNRLARLLISVGVGPESRVATAMSRGVDLLVGIHAVVAAGGAYVPVDPDHPADRIAYVLDSANPVVVLSTQRDGFDAGQRSVLHVDTLDVSAYSADPITDADRVAPLRGDNTAYVIYTSGSTGRPKGVAVTHAAIVNRLRWMQAQYLLDESDVVLWKTPVTFDVSVWELFWALDEGARLVVAAPDGHRDPAYLAQVIERESVTTLHFVPSMMAAFVGAVTAGSCPSVRRVFASGEALTGDVAQRLRTVVPSTALHNLYGPTEAAVDVTFHEVTDADTVNVPIGAPVFNTEVFVLDARLRPVPVGVPGELYLAGVQLARGYVGRADLTADRFVANPFGGAAGAVGERLYRTGDVVRWSAAGELEYLGRSDFQVKLRGQRIELGEIESALLGCPGVEHAAAVVHADPVAGERLVGYVAPAGVDSSGVEEAARAALPSYMVPSQIMVLDALPLNASGKLDRKALPAPVFEAAVFRAPTTPLEQGIAEVMAEVLGLGSVSVDDSFFALGGDSIVSIQFVSRARARGILFSPRDVFEQRTVAELAEVAVFDDGTTVVQRLAELPGRGVGRLPLTPLMAEFLAGGGDYRTFNQAVPVQVPASMNFELLTKTIAAVVDAHDMLRATLDRDENGEWVFEARPVGSVDVAGWIRHYPVPADIEDTQLTAIASKATDAALRELDPQSGELMRFLWFDFDGAERHGVLYIVGHHFVVDGVSWRILVPDLAIAWSQLTAGQPVALAPVGTSMRRWTHALAEEAFTPARVAELELWRELLDVSDPPLGSRALDPVIDIEATQDRITVEIPAEVTGAVLRDLPELYHASVNDALLTALAMALVAWRRKRGLDISSALVRMEGHGREETLIPGADLSRTVGWFTSAYPVRTDLAGIDLADAFAGGVAAGEAVKAVKEQLLAVPDRGMGYGLLRHFNAEGAGVLPALPDGQVSFNYLGRVGGTEVPTELAEIGWGLSGALGAMTSEVESTIPARAVIDINAIVVGDAGALSAGFTYTRGVIARADVQELADLWGQALAGLAAHSGAPGAGGLTPSDLPLVTVGQRDIDVWEQHYPNLADVWQLTPVQSGLLFHAMLNAEAGEADVYSMQATLYLGGYVDADRLRGAAQALIDRYTNLRTAFTTDSAGIEVQVVLDRVDVPWREVDVTGVAESERAGAAREVLSADREAGFDMSRPPLMRFTLVRTGQDGWQLGVTVHHILLDGWSMPLVMRDLLVLYAVSGDLSVLPRVREYRNFLVWLAGRDEQRSLDTWARALYGVEGPTLLESTGPRSDAGSGKGTVDVELSEAGTARLSEVASGLGVTVNTMVQAAWAILLGAITGSSDVVFGAVVSGRPAEVAGVESMAGLFINTIPVRVQIDADASVAGMVGRLQSEQADLLEHHHVGLTEVHRAAGVGALFNTVLGFQSYPIDRAALSDAGSAVEGLRVTGIHMHDRYHYPLRILAAVAVKLGLTFQYDPAVFDTAEIETLADRLLRVLSTMVDNSGIKVGNIEVFNRAARGALIGGWSGASVASIGDQSAVSRMPVTPVERSVAAAFEEVLDAVDIGADDNFFELGGNSLSAMRVAVLLREAGISVPLQWLFSSPTPAAIARQLEGGAGADDMGLRGGAADSHRR